MSGISLLLIEVLLSGVVIGFAVREVIVTRRRLREYDDDATDPAVASDAPPDDSVEARPGSEIDPDSRA